MDVDCVLITALIAISTPVGIALAYAVFQTVKPRRRQ